MIKHFAGKSDLRLATASRRLFSDKNENGRVVIIGGSSNFHGAPALASLAAYETLAALRVGIGYATTYVPKSIIREVSSISPNIIVRSLSGNDLSISDLPKLKLAISKVEVVVIGPGLGRKKSSLAAVSRLAKLLLRSNKRVVIDADAIAAISKFKLNKNFTITPNSREFSLFYKKGIGEEFGTRAHAAIVVARRINANVVLKGHETIVTNGNKIKVISSRSSALATMGTGDVLAGLIGGYAALNRDMFVASVAGAYLHSLMGDKLHLKMGNHLLASDLISEIPKAIKEFDKNAK